MAKFGERNLPKGEKVVVETATVVTTDNFITRTSLRESAKDLFNKQEKTQDADWDKQPESIQDVWIRRVIEQSQTISKRVNVSFEIEGIDVDKIDWYDWLTSWQEENKFTVKRMVVNTGYSEIPPPRIKEK